jgi:hypothetical protein
LGEVLDMKRLAVDDRAARHQAAGEGERLGRIGALAALRHQREPIALQTVDEHIHCVAQACGTLGDDIENGLKIRG